MCPYTQAIFTAVSELEFLLKILKTEGGWKNFIVTLSRIR